MAKRKQEPSAGEMEIPPGCLCVTAQKTEKTLSQPFDLEYEHVDFAFAWHSLLLQLACECSTAQNELFSLKRFKGFI